MRARVVRKIILIIIMTTLMGVLMWYGFTIFRPLPEGYYHQTSKPGSEIDFTKDTPGPINAEEQDPQSKVNQTGWIPDWDFEAGFRSLQEYPTAFDSISPVWYHLNPNGTVRVNRVGLARLRDFTKTHGIKLIPSIASFSADEFHKILDDREKRDNHIKFLLNEVSEYELDGIDLDYESIYMEDQAELLEFVRTLYTELDREGKILSFAVHPTWSADQHLFGLNQTRLAQNYYELSRYTHELRIMTYNYTGYKSRYAGPVAPIDWQEAVIRYTIPRVDRSKIVLGIPHYGYDGWSNNPNIPEPYLGITANGYVSKVQADAVTFSQVQKWFAYKVSDVIDPGSQEKFLIYNYKNKNYFVYYQDSQSLIANTKLAQKYGIYGLAYWRLGGEDTKIYRLVEDL